MSDDSHAPFGCDVLIIGGGITGAASAYYLSRAGINVTLLEQFDLNTQASGRNAGSLHGQIQHALFRTRGLEWAEGFVPAQRLLLDSLKIWQHLSSELNSDLEVTTEGGLLVAESDQQAERVAAKVAFETAQGFPVELVVGSDLRKLAPYLSERIVAAEYCSAEGRGNPLLAAPALARAAALHGAQIQVGIKVLGIEAVTNGFSITTNAYKIECTKLVVCAGGDIPRLARLLGVHVPMTDEPVQVHATEPVAPLIPHLVYFEGGQLTLKQAKAGSILIGGGWPATIDPETGHPTVSSESMRSNLRVARRVAPSIGRANLLRAWAGVGNGTPDMGPVIGECESAPGSFVAMFPHMGYTSGPLIGQILSALVQDQDPGRDLTSFAPGRFAASINS